MMLFKKLFNYSIFLNNICFFYYSIFFFMIIYETYMHKFYETKIMYKYSKRIEYIYFLSIFIIFSLVNYFIMHLHKNNQNIIFHFFSLELLHGS
jgi:hypothetical protein